MSSPDALPRLNSFTEGEARALMLRCCGSTRWAQAMTESRPFRDEAGLFETASAIWRGLKPEDWIEAFAAHPKIGGKDALREKFLVTRDLGPRRASPSRVRPGGRPRGPRRGQRPL